MTVQIIQLQGLDSRLYQLVAPLVMNPDVLRKNNNYPFKTADNFRWFIAVAEGQVVGFMPVELKESTAVINNYYVNESEGEIALPLLISEVVSALESEKRLTSVALTEDRATFEEQGFVVEKEWKRYLKMCKE